MKRVLSAVALFVVGGLGACSPASKGTDYLSIRNDSTREVYVTYVGGVRNVSATIAPSSRVVMRGRAFGATIYQSKGSRAYDRHHVYDGQDVLAMFNSVDARMLPSGDQVRVFEENGRLRAAVIGDTSQEPTK